MPDLNRSTSTQVSVIIRSEFLLTPNLHLEEAITLTKPHLEESLRDTLQITTEITVEVKILIQIKMGRSLTCDMKVLIIELNTQQ